MEKIIDRRAIEGGFVEVIKTANNGYAARTNKGGVITPILHKLGAIETAIHPTLAQARQAAGIEAPKAPVKLTAPKSAYPSLKNASKSK